MGARFALLVLPAALLAGCGGGIPPAQNYATVQGRAYDVASNAPVAGATLCINTIQCATSANDGTYRIGNVPLGTCDITTITPPNGYRVQGNVTPCGSVTAGQTVTIDVPLTRF
jgi:hypothetical protein